MGKRRKIAVIGIIALLLFLDNPSLLGTMADKAKAAHCCLSDKIHDWSNLCDSGYYGWKVLKDFLMKWGF